jgi:Domain of unknown function (DUF3482)/50S ribosome-binding GTPase
MTQPKSSASESSVTVTLSLASHTNVGKTTMARTLLRREIGIVRDEANVTLFNESHVMLEAGGHTLKLWDTPGFSDTGRLLKRLQKTGNRVVSFLTQTWDRIRNKELWCSQQALINVREDADVVLYLINAVQGPGAEPFVEQEMEILGWLGKPVLVLLNQTGPPRPASEEEAEEQAWRDQLTKFPIVREVLNLDAFTRCWVQENHLMEKIAVCLPEDKQVPFAILRAAWNSRNEKVFITSMKSLSNQLTANALDGMAVKPESLVQKLGFNRGELEKEWSEARQKLSESLAARAEQTMNQLIALHGLEGSDDKDESLRSTRRDFIEPKEVEAELWSAISGIATGALAGLVVDLKAGGLTFGGGALLGGIGGGLSAYALIKTYNLARGDDNKLHWSREHFREQVKLAILSYLAVSHFGRGRGAWRRDPRPEFWNREVSAVVDGMKDRIDNTWKKASFKDASLGVVHDDLEIIVHEIGRAVLARLYPE